MKPLKPSYSIRTLEITDLESVTELQSESFRTREPTTMAMRFTEAEYRPHARSLLLGAIGDKLSLVCEDTINREIIGYALSEDFSKIHNFSNPFSPKYPPIVGLLEKLSHDFQKTCIGKMGYAIHLLMVGVGRSCLNEGIGTHLVIKSLEMAKLMGFKVAVAEATSNYSQRIFSRLGFKIKRVIPYSEYTFNNTRPFSEIRDPLMATFVSKDLPRD